MTNTNKSNPMARTYKEWRAIRNAERSYCSDCNAVHGEDCPTAAARETTEVYGADDGWEQVHGYDY